MNQSWFHPRWAWQALTSPLTTPLERTWKTARSYTWSQGRADALAGLTVSVIAVPQAMAYAIIAQVPPQYGLYTVVIHCLIGSFFNSQPLLSVGPINTQSLLVASIVTRLALPGMDETQRVQLFVQLAIGLSFIKGVMQMLMAQARLGNLVRYVSRSVFVGFTAGAGVLIAAGQINSFLGFDVQRSGDHWPGLIGVAQRLMGHADQISGPAVMLGLGAMALVIGCRFVSRLMPGPLLAVVLSAAVVWWMGWTPADLTLLGDIPQDLDIWSNPLAGSVLTNFDALLAGGLALSLLGVLEAYSIGQSIAAKTGGRVCANQEMFSQGLTGFVGSFFSCIPGSGSFARSALNHYAGAQTLFSGIFNAFFVLGIFLLFAPAARYVPMAAIAAILFVVAYGLIDWPYFLRIARSNRGDAAVCFGTFWATLFFPLAYAVFVGIFLNLALYLKRASQLHMTEMVQSTQGPFIERPLRTRSRQRDVVFIQLEGDLFFGLADELRDKLSELSASGVRVVILRLKRTHSIDATVLSVLEAFTHQMHARQAHVILCGIKPELMQCLEGYGVVRQLGQDNVFATGFGVFASAKQALKRARQLIGESIDIEGFDVDDDAESDPFHV